MQRMGPALGGRADRQRAAGREAPGKAFRLFTEAAFRALPATAEPEIRRAPLAGVSLQLLALGVRDLQVPHAGRCSLRPISLRSARGSLLHITGGSEPVGSD